MRAELRDRALERASLVLEPIARQSHLLDTINWSREVEHEFFLRHASRLPEPTYAIDRDRAKGYVAELSALERELAGDHPLFAWLRALAHSHADANRMLLSLETPEFYVLSRALYGGARTTALDADTSNLDFAEHLASRLGPQTSKEEASASPPWSPDETLDTDAFIAEMERRLASRHDPIELEIVRDEKLTAKVSCGVTRMRVRDGATFTRVETEGLFYHEIETHALTGQNGASQPRLPFLRSGGPRSTRTQEGLAVFSELYHHALPTERLRRLVERVRLVGMAEDGASFLDVYRHVLDRGCTPHEAFLDAQRIFRGGMLEGGACFTKDASYLSGLMDVYNFLRVTQAEHSPIVAEVLVSGRIALEDVEALVWLRDEGVMEPPRLVPAWLAGKDRLLSYFAFTSFLNEVDLSPIEGRHRALLARVTSKHHEEQAEPKRRA